MLRLLKLMLSPRDRVVFNTPDGPVELEIRFTGKYRVEIGVKAPDSVEIDRIEHPENRARREARRGGGS